MNDLEMKNYYDPSPPKDGEYRRFPNGKVVIWDEVNGLWGRIPSLDRKEDKPK